MLCTCICCARRASGGKIHVWKHPPGWGSQQRDLLWWLCWAGTHGQVCDTRMKSLFSLSHMHLGIVQDAPSELFPGESLPLELSFHPTLSQSWVTLLVTKPPLFPSSQLYTTGRRKMQDFKAKI